MGVILIIKNASYTQAPSDPGSSGNTGNTGGNTGNTDQPQPTPTCATPVIAIDGNTATITCATTGATIHYSTDGSTPTTASAVYSGPLNLTASATVKAIAAKDGYNTSLTATRQHTFTFVPVDIEAEETVGAYLNTSGSTTSLGGWTYSSYVEIPDGATTVQGTINTFYTNSQAICYYDSSKNFISGYNDLEELGPGCGENWGNKYGTINSPIPQGAAYMRYCYANTVRDFPEKYLKATLKFK